MAVALAHCLILALLLLLCCSAADNNDEVVPAVFVFGDSLVDTGNNDYIRTVAKADMPPYGRDFPGGVATGRFSNGRGVSDYIAQVLGVKDLLPPYLDPSLGLQDLLTGVSFASAVSGFDPRTPRKANAIPMLTQLNMFKEAVKFMNASVGAERTADIVSNSAYMTFCGSNDLTNTYSQVKLWYTEESYTDLVITLALDFYTKLYEAGARRIGVVGLPPTGCAPFMRTITGGLTRGCSENLNRLMRLFNSKLSSMVDTMNQQLPGARVVLFELYDSFQSLLQNPAPYGIEVTTRGCCGTGNIELGVLCVLPGTCPDASKYFFFDSFHPTELVSRILTYQVMTPNVVNKFFSSSSAPSPI